MQQNIRYGATNERHSVVGAGARLKITQPRVRPPIAPQLMDHAMESRYLGRIPVWQRKAAKHLLMVTMENNVVYHFGRFFYQIHDHLLRKIQGR